MLARWLLATGTRGRPSHLIQTQLRGISSTGSSDGGNATSKGSGDTGVCDAAQRSGSGANSTQQHIHSSTSHSPLELTGQMSGAWGEILEAARVDRVKLRQLVTTLHRHCLLTQTCPPLPAFNALLKIANQARDRQAVDKLVEVMHNNKMQVDSESWARLNEHFSFSYSSPPPHAFGSGSGSSSGSGGGAAGSTNKGQQ